jgi:DNA (cytosine-5)-methyltransferase 1
VKFVSLFAGIGAEALGLESAGHTPVAFSEVDPLACQVLNERWPEVPNLGDITAVDWNDVDASLVAGGFPCQDISNAHTNGTRHALNGTKSGLWSEYARALEAIRPEWAIIENVAAWQRWVPDVRSDLAGLGYASVPLELSAGTFGAPHVRPRTFVVANADSEGEPLRAIHEAVARIRPLPVRGGRWRSPPPGGFRVDDGTPNGMDRCRAIGNAVVPDCLSWLGQRLDEKVAA